MITHTDTGSASNASQAGQDSHIHQDSQPNQARWNDRIDNSDWSKADNSLRSDSSNLSVAFVLGAAGLLLGFMALRAWSSDDAFITLRTVDNFVHGFGLRYNLDERVQAFTHPLWALLLSAVYALVRSAYWTLVGTSLLTSALATLVLAWRLPASRLQALMVLGILGSSQSFVDYSTSGLENPMTHLLLVLFAWRLLVKPGASELPEAFDLALLAALATLNRMDTLLLFLPALALVWWRWRSWRSFSELVVGFLPFALWEAFSVVYYGFPFPNTAYAKLGADIPRMDLVYQGLTYLQDSARHDPVTLAALGLSVGLAWYRGSQWQRALSMGGVLYLAYVVSVGGDFMRGRFLSPLVVLAVILLARIDLPRRALVAISLLALTTGIGFTWPRALHPPEVVEVPASGIVDERAFYRGVTAITSLAENPVVLQLTPRWADSGEVQVRSIRLGGAIGLEGFRWGPEVHIVDYLGLADPLLARLPTQDRTAWRIGHFERKLPLGYFETVASDTNWIQDPSLAEYYDRLQRITRGELWTLRRWRDIVSLNLGGAENLIDVEEYSRPYSWVVSASNFGRGGTGAPSIGAASVPLPARNGILLQFERTMHCPAIDLGLAAGPHYRLTYYAAGEPVVTAARRAHYVVPSDSVPVDALSLSGAIGGVRSHHVAVPEAVAARGYDALLLFPIAANESSLHAFYWVEACTE